MSIEAYQQGDMVFSRIDLRNDGSIPDLAPDAALAPPGARGVVIRVGSLESAPETKVYLVRFEGPDGELGPPVGAFAHELTQDTDWAAQQRT